MNSQHNSSRLLSSWDLQSIAWFLRTLLQELRPLPPSVSQNHTSKHHYDFYRCIQNKVILFVFHQTICVPHHCHSNSHFWSTLLVTLYFWSHSSSDLIYLDSFINHKPNLTHKLGFLNPSAASVQRSEQSQFNIKTLQDHLSDVCNDHFMLLPSGSAPTLP